MLPVPASSAGPWLAQVGSHFGECGFSGFMYGTTLGRVWFGCSSLGGIRLGLFSGGARAPREVLGSSGEGEKTF